MQLKERMTKKQAVFQETQPTEFRVGNLRSAEDRTVAAHFIKLGYAVGLYNRGVCALIGKGDSDGSTGTNAFFERVIAIKGKDGTGQDRRDQPLAAWFPTEQLVDRFLDRTKISPHVAPLFQDAQTLAEQTGSLMFLRVPLREDAIAGPHPVLPKFMYSVDTATHIPYIMNWDPHGHRVTEVFLQDILATGVQIPAITSLNAHGIPEIVDQHQGEEFSREHFQDGLAMFLHDPNDTGIAKGSYIAYLVGPEGIQLIREGNIPHKIAGLIFGGDVDTHQYQKPKYPQSQWDQLEVELRTTHLSGSEIRKKVLDFLSPERQGTNYRDKEKRRGKIRFKQ